MLREAIGVGMEEEPEVTRLRSQLMVQIPAVRSRMVASMAATGRMLSAAVAERTGHDRDSLEVRVFTMSLVGGLAEISQYWAENGFRDELPDLVDRALDVIEHGLPTRKP